MFKLVCNKTLKARNSTPTHPNFKPLISLLHIISEKKWLKKSLNSSLNSLLNFSIALYRLLKGLIG